MLYPAPFPLVQMRQIVLVLLALCAPAAALVQQILFSQALAVWGVSPVHAWFSLAATGQCRGYSYLHREQHPLLVRYFCRKAHAHGHLFSQAVRRSGRHSGGHCLPARSSSDTPACYHRRSRILPLENRTRRGLQTTPHAAADLTAATHTDALPALLFPVQGRLGSGIGAVHTHSCCGIPSPQGYHLSGQRPATEQGHLRYSPHAPTESPADRRNPPHGAGLATAPAFPVGIATWRWPFAGRYGRLLPEAVPPSCRKGPRFRTRPSTPENAPQYALQRSRRRSVVPGYPHFRRVLL